MRRQQKQKKRNKIRKAVLPFLFGGCFGSAVTIFLTEYFNLLYFIHEKDKSNNSKEILIEKETLQEKKLTTGQKNKNGWKSIDIFYGNAEEGLGISSEQKFYGQVNQDEIVLDLIGHNGYFIDLAANDAVEFSNTLVLERYGWDGLCIEPNPNYWFGLSHRKCTVIGALIGGNTSWGDGQAFEKVQVKFRGVFGGIVGKMDDKLANRKREPDATKENRYLVPLIDIFNKYNVPKTIDYLNLDVEGAEYMIMEHFPFTKHTIRLMTVERPSKELKELLEKNDYMFVKELSWWGETLWAHKDMGFYPDHPKIKNIKTDHKK